jgi:hypothetical protein
MLVENFTVSIPSQDIPSQDIPFMQWQNKQHLHTNSCITKNVALQTVITSFKSKNNKTSEKLIHWYVSGTPKCNGHAKSRCSVSNPAGVTRQSVMVHMHSNN